MIQLPIYCSYFLTLFNVSGSFTDPCYRLTPLETDNMWRTIRVCSFGHVHGVAVHSTPYLEAGDQQVIIPSLNMADQT